MKQYLYMPKHLISLNKKLTQMKKEKEDNLWGKLKKVFNLS